MKYENKFDPQIFNYVWFGCNAVYFNPDYQ